MALFIRPQIPTLISSSCRPDLVPQLVQLVHDTPKTNILKNILRRTGPPAGAIGEGRGGPACLDSVDTISVSGAIFIYLYGPGVWSAIFPGIPETGIST